MTVGEVVPDRAAAQVQQAARQVRSGADGAPPLRRELHPVPDNLGRAKKRVCRADKGVATLDSGVPFATRTHLTPRPQLKDGDPGFLGAARHKDPPDPMGPARRRRPHDFLGAALAPRASFSFHTAKLLTRCMSTPCHHCQSRHHVWHDSDMARMLLRSRKPTPSCAWVERYPPASPAPPAFPPPPPSPSPSLAPDTREVGGRTSFHRGVLAGDVDQLLPIEHGRRRQVADGRVPHEAALPADAAHHLGAREGGPGEKHPPGFRRNCQRRFNFELTLAGGRGDERSRGARSSEASSSSPRHPALVHAQLAVGLGRVVRQVD